MGKFGWLILGAIASPVLLFFGELFLMAAGIVAIAVVGSAFLNELKALELKEDDHG